MRTAVVGLLLSLAVTPPAISAELYASPSALNAMLVGCWAPVNDEANDRRHAYAICFDGSSNLELWQASGSGGKQSSGSYTFVEDRLEIAADVEGWSWPQPQISCDVHVRSDEVVILSRCEDDVRHSLANIVLRRPVVDAPPVRSDVSESQLPGCWERRTSVANWRPRGAPPLWTLDLYCFKPEGTWESTSGGNREWGEFYSTGGGSFSTDNGQLILADGSDHWICNASIEAKNLLILDCGDDKQGEYLRVEASR